MQKDDILRSNPIGFYRNAYGHDVTLYRIVKNQDSTFSAIFAHYTGAGYNVHTAKIYTDNDNPYIVYNRHRVHISDFSRVTIDEMKRVLISGTGVNVWDYIQ